MKYLYTGPNSGVTLQDGTEILLWKDTEVDLPETSEYVQTLVSLGLLKTISIEANKKTKKEEKENVS